MIFDKYINYITWKILYSSKLKIFKDIHKGETCFIIGNGPSLNNMDLSKLSNVHTFGLNKIYLMFDKVKLNLSYLVSVQDNVIEQSVEKFESFNFPMFLSYKKAKRHGFKNNNINYILTGAAKGKDFQDNITEIVPEGATVTYVAMQIAYYMGFQKVFLIGVDHNFIANGNPREIQVLKGDDPNHFDPNYFKDMKWGLPDLETSEKYYNIAKKTYEDDGREILDATVGGKLNVFNKISFEKAIAISTKK